MRTTEPLIDLDDVQGNVYPGFNKDHQTFRFLEISDVPQARLALAELIPHVARSSAVRAYGEARSIIKAQNIGGPSGLTATWMTIALGYTGCAKLFTPSLADGLGEGAFKAGLAIRSPLLGDPLDAAARGHPSNWIIGATGSPPIDLIMTIAGDRREDVDAYASFIDQLLAAYAAPDGLPALRPVRKDLKGDTLGGDLNGHEHFGFKDGISQPGIRGRLAASPETFITPRIIDSSSPLANRFGRPGQVLLWPGQLLLGQPRQNGQDPDIPLEPLPLAAEWLRNGSFMVLRLLEQDVPGFWAQMRSYANQVLSATDDLSTDWIASRVVGRWRSGAPVTRTPAVDNPNLVIDNRVSNDFGFRFDGVAIPLVAGETPLPHLPLSRADPNGMLCPFAGHIRKVNPRDDAVEQGSPNDTLVRMIARRGVPYGTRFADPRHAVSDGSERGLIFVSYQASIERQFEFLMQQWVNGDDAPHAGSGRDAVLGHHLPQGDMLTTSFDVFDKADAGHTVAQTVDYITPRGGGYFFTPSISALTTLATGNLNSEM